MAEITERDIRAVISRFIKGERDIEQWLTRPAPAFGMKSPKELIDTGHGDKIVLYLLEINPSLGEGPTKDIVDKLELQKTTHTNL